MDTTKKPRKAKSTKKVEAKVEIQKTDSKLLQSVRNSGCNIIILIILLGAFTVGIILI